MNGWFQWQTRQTSRRRFLRQSLIGIFGAFTALSVGQLDALATCGNKCNTQGSCSGPFNSGRCPSANCYHGWGCQNGGGTSCSYTSCCCESGSNCWTYLSGNTCYTCCDCYCCWSGGCYYCYCGPGV
jgi:hypothetical protein